MDKQANGTYTTTVLAVGMALLVVTSMGVGVVTAQDEFDVTLDVPQDVTAGEQTTLSASVSVPDLLRDYENDLTVTFSVDGTQVGAKTVTITDGTTKQIDLTHTFENSGTKEVTVTAETSLGGQDFSGSASATVDVNEPPVSIDGDLSTSLSVPESPTVGDETTITIENAIPEFTNAQEGYLTVNLFVGQQEIASRNVSVQAGDIKDIEVFHTFETTDQVTVKADATLVVGDKTATGDASTTVQAQEPLAIDGNVSSTLRVPDSPTVGNETTITVENSIPELSGTQDAELNVRLLIDGTQIDSRSITAQEAQTETVDFSYVFDTTDEATVTVEVTLTVGGQSTSDRVSKPVQPQEPLAIDGELSSSISVPDNPTVGEETTITVSNRIPEFSGTQQGNLTLQLFVDGDRVDSKSITVQEAGTQEVTFIHTYQTTEATNVEINATLSIGTIATTKTPSETVQPVLSIDGQLSSNLSISDDPTVGEPTTISIEHTIPEFSGRQNGNLTIHLLINGNRVDTKTATVTAGEVSSVEFTRTFENTDEKTITVEATLSVGNQAVNASASQRIRPIGINEELSLRILTPDSPTVGEETVISVENEIPSFTGVQEGTLTLRLLIDGDEITTREVDVESGDLKTVEFNHTFETSEETTVSVEATLTVGTLNVSTSREIFIQPQEALSIDGRLAGEISLSQTPVVGEEVTLTVDTTVPEFTGVQEGQLRLHLSRNGTEINSINITVESGDQPSVEFTPRVETAGPTEFTVNGSLTLRNRTLNMNLSQPIRPQEPISGGDELPTNLTVVGSPRVGKETTITINNRIPSLTGTGNGELTLRLLIDGEEVASKNITIAGDEREETNFSYEFDASGETTVTVKAILTVAGQTVSGSATQTVDVGEALPETTTLEGAAFTVPDSLQDEVNAYRNSVSEEVGASAFVLATREDLYIVFTSDEPSKGKAIVEGITLNRTLSEGNLTYGAIAATNTTFATNGTEVSLETVADNPDQYRLELVQITAHHRRISTLTDPDGGGDFTLSSTAGVLLEQPRTPSSLLQNLTGKARTLSGNISTEEIETILDTPRRTHLRTFSFETAFWADTEATVDGIVLEPGSTARQFINEYDQAGTVDAEEGRPILYVVNEDFQPREMADVNSIKSQADALNGEVVTTEVLLNQQRISIQETLEHSTGCNPDLLQIQTPQGPVCVNVVQDNLLHGGVAWNNVPQSRDDVLLVVGVSSRHQDVPAATEQGRYQLTGEVVSTARLNESLPDGSVLIIYELDRKDDINYDELREEARAIIESRLEQVRDRLREQLIEIAGEPATNLSLAENITTGEETPITAETRIPQLTGAQSGQLTLTLFVDGNETANKTFTVEGNSSETVNFTHVFSADGETTVTVQANLTAGGQTITRNVSRTVFVGERFPDLTTIRGAAFAVPESLEDEVQAYRANTSEDLNASAFILATQTELYVVFTDRQPTKGRATVKGIVLNRTVSGENLTYGAVAATDTSFETTGNETTVQAVADNSEQYRLELVRITANYRRISTLTDPDQGDDFTLSTTSGLLLENPRTATSLFQNLSGKARHLSWNTSTDRIDEALNHSRRTHLHTFSFETKFWTDAEATVDAIVLDPSSAAQQFIDEYDRPGVAHAEDGEPILYVVEEDFHPQSMENVASIKSQADSLDGEVVKTTVRLYQKRVSVQETVEHNTGCSEDRLEIQTPEGSVCVNVVQDNLLHGGVAWNSIPQSRDDALLVLGVSSRHQDTPDEFKEGRYRLAGEVVSTSRLNESLPDGSVLMIYELERQGQIDYDAVEEEARALIEARVEQLRTRLREELVDRAGEDETSLQITPASQTLTPDESATYEIVLDEVDGNLTAYDLTVSTTEPGTAMITDASNEIGGVSRTKIATDNSSVEITASGSSTGGDETNVVLATVTVTGEAAGNATLSVTPEFIVGGENGIEYSSTTINDAAVTVEENQQDEEQAETNLSLAPSTQRIAPSTTTTYDVVVGDVVGGVGSYNLEVGISNTSAARITDATNEIGGSAEINRTADGSAVQIGAFSGDTVDNGSEVVIATVTVTGQQPGTTELTLEPSSVGNESGTQYAITAATGATVTIRDQPPAPDVTDDGEPAQDLDNDGEYEDVNGDGSVTPGDATVIFNSVFEGDAAVTENPSLFDYNGDGSVTPGDATVLFNEVFES